MQNIWPLRSHSGQTGSRVHVHSLSLGSVLAVACRGPALWGSSGSTAGSLGLAQRKPVRKALAPLTGGSPVSGRPSFPLVQLAAMLVGPGLGGARVCWHWVCVDEGVAFTGGGAAGS